MAPMFGFKGRKDKGKDAFPPEPDDVLEEGLCAADQMSSDRCKENARK